MVKLLGLCFIVLSACFAWEASAQEKQALRPVQTIPLPEVKGRLDHMGVDLEKEPPVCRRLLQHEDAGMRRVIRLGVDADKERWRASSPDPFRRNSC